MDNQETDTPPTTRRSMPLPVLIIGGILWTIVFAVVGMLVFNRPPAEPEADGSKPAQATNGKTESDDPKNGAKPIVITPEDPPADGDSQAGWDPKGVEDFTFTDRSGEKVSKKDLLGKPWVTGFVFTRCAGPCPRVTGAMYVLQDELDDYDFNLVTFTVDPEYDTVARLSTYADQWRANPKRWYFLTGDQADIYGLINRSFQMPVQEIVGKDRKPGFEVLHSRNLMLVNAEGVVIGKYDVLKDGDIVALRRELKKLAPKSETKASNKDE